MIKERNNATSSTSMTAIESKFGVRDLSEIMKYLGDYVDINDVWQVCGGAYIYWGFN
jgi:hypothetical protein